jgi:hypothetical protein
MLHVGWSFPIRTGPEIFSLRGKEPHVFEPAVVSYEL